ncbi:hypothetical protein HUN42_00021 [Streptomyces phage Dagobah]|nr:hypothetical protein HUN42_00021 [Streptomyces phage Dagobah]
MAASLLRINVRAAASGPLFDHRAARYFDDFADDLEQEGAQWALDHIKDTYHTHFKEPTGYYESHVRVRREFGAHVVTDGGHSGPVYGPWLEGVGSRNFPATRFRGYHAFRKASEALQRRIGDMGDRLFRARYENRF